jgi:hypothetical protein
LKITWAFLYVQNAVCKLKEKMKEDKRREAEQRSTTEIT